MHILYVLIKRIRNKYPLLISYEKQNSYINNFDSLRGIAALLVVVSHIPGIKHPSLGATGVWIFFVLSGFLLYWFFENKNLKDIILTTPNYFWRRFFRLIPAYYLCLVVYALAYFVIYNSSMLGWFFKHITFQEAVGHLWSVKIELLFYFILPFFMIPFGFLKKNRDKMILSLVSIFAVYYYFEYKAIIRVNAASLQMAPYMTPFFIGIFLSIIRNNIPDISFSWLYYLGWSGILFLSLDFNWLIQLREFLPYKHIDNIGWRHPYLIYPFAGFLVLGCYKKESNLLNNKLIISLGICAYSFYLWHILVINALKHLASNTYTIVFITVIGSYIMAVYTYHLVEYNGIKLSKKYQLKFSNKI